MTKRDVELRRVRRGVFTGWAACVLAITLTVHLNHQRVEDIRDTHRESIVRACQEQNARNERTVRTVRVLAQHDPRPDIEERVRSTIRLIDALAPVQNCERLADRQTRG